MEWTIDIKGGTSHNVQGPVVRHVGVAADMMCLADGFDMLDFSLFM